MIEAKNLVKIYKPKKGVEVRALDGVSLKLPSKGMVFLLGKSGSGKSTLLNVLGGLDSFNEGEIIIKGTSAKDFKQSHYDSYRNTYIGFIFQEYNVLDEFTVGANIALAIELQGRKPTSEEINNILKKVELLSFANRKPNELSGGQKQRVAIARALVKNPEIIMADEPTGALDSATGKQVFDTLKELSKEKLVLIVSHDRDFAEQYADRIIELADGKIISDVERAPINEQADNESEETQAEEPLTFNGDEIDIKAGYELTNEDLERINKYIKRLSMDAKLIIKGEKRPDGQVNHFVNTDQSKIAVKKDDNFKLIKSKLSLKNAFKIGASGLKHKKVRLVFTIILSFIAFTLFGLADTIASYDNVNTCITSIVDSNIDYAAYQKMLKVRDYWSKNEYRLSDNDIEKISTETGIPVKGVYKKNYQEVSFDSHIAQPEDEQVMKEVQMIFPTRFSGFVEVEENDLTAYNYQLLGNSKMPEGNKNEIAVSKYIYQLFEKTGFKYYDKSKGEVTKPITGYDDLIGMTMSISNYGDYKITAIIDTGFDYTRYSSLANEATDTADMLLQMALSQELSSLQQYSMNCVAFVGPGTVTTMKSEHSSIGVTYYNSGYLEAYKGKKQTPDMVQYDFCTGFNKIASLKEAEKMIKWLDTGKTTLGENEYIVDLNFLQSYMQQEPHIDIYSEGFLKSEDQELSSKMAEEGLWSFTTIGDMLNNYKQIAAYKYAYDPEKSQQVRDYVSKFEGENIVNMTSKEISNYYVFNYYSDNSKDFTDYSYKYFDSILESYDLERIFINSTVIEKLNTNITYGSQSYNSYGGGVMRYSELGNQYEDILKNKFFHDNFETAKELFLKENSDYTDDQGKNPDKSYADYYMIRDFYISKLNSSESFMASHKKEFFDTYWNIIKDYVAFEGLSLRFQNYRAENDEDREKIFAFNVVGVIDSRDSVLVVPDKMYIDIVGEHAQGVYDYAVAPMSQNRSEIEKIVKFSYTQFGEKEDLRYGLTNSVTYELDMIDEILEVLGQVFLYVGIALAVFASLMLSNFIATSVSLKKQEIGILRAIGSRSNDVFRIFFAEAFIIAMINYVLSLAGTIGISILINSILREDAGILVTILGFGVRQVGILFAISIGIAFLSTFLPVKKIASKKPIDAIRNR